MIQQLFAIIAGMTPPCGAVADAFATGAIQDNADAPANGVCGIRFNRDGTVDKKIASTYSKVGDWIPARCQSATVGDAYQVSMTISSGSDPDSGLSLASNYHTISAAREWIWTQSESGTAAASFSANVREIADTSNNMNVTGSIEAIRGG